MDNAAEWPWRTLVGIALTCIFLCMRPHLAGARDLPIVPLALHMPANCVEPTALEALAERLGVRFERVESAGLTVRIAAVATGFEAQLDGLSAETRRFSGLHCDQVAQAAALIVALSAQPMAVSQRVVSAEELEPPRTGSLRIRVQHMHVAAEPSLDWGSLPRFTSGLGVALGGRMGPWLAELTGAAYLPRTTRDGPTREASAELSLANGGLRLCHAFRLRYASLGPCLAAELGAVWARGLAVTAPREVTGVWSAAVLALSMSAHGRRFAPGLRLDAVVPMQRPAFDVDGYGEVFQARRLVFRAALIMRLDVF